jgi:hypothetical protein
MSYPKNFFFLLNDKELKYTQYIKTFSFYIDKIKFININYKMCKLLNGLNNVICHLAYFILPKYFTDIIVDPQQLWSSFICFNRDLQKHIKTGKNNNFIHGDIYQSLARIKNLRNSFTHTITINNNENIKYFVVDIENLLSNIISAKNIIYEDNKTFYVYILNTLYKIYHKTIKLFYNNLKIFIDNNKLFDLHINVRKDVKILPQTSNVNIESDIIVNDKLVYEKCTNYSYLPDYILQYINKHKKYKMDTIKNFKDQKVLEKTTLDKDANLLSRNISILISLDGKWKNTLMLFKRFNGSNTYFYIFSENNTLTTVLVINTMKVILVI